jgi:hypothetical protein
VPEELGPVDYSNTPYLSVDQQSEPAELDRLSNPLLDKSNPAIKASVTELGPEGEDFKGSPATKKKRRKKTEKKSKGGAGPGTGAGAAAHSGDAPPTTDPAASSKYNPTMAAQSTSSIPPLGEHEMPPEAMEPISTDDILPPEAYAPVWASDPATMQHYYPQYPADQYGGGYPGGQGAYPVVGYDQYGQPVNQYGQPLDQYGQPIQVSLVNIADYRGNGKFVSYYIKKKKLCRVD